LLFAALLLLLLLLLLPPLAVALLRPTLVAQMLLPVQVLPGTWSRKPEGDHFAFVMFFTKSHVARHTSHVKRHTSHVVAAAVKPSLQALLAAPLDPTLSPSDDARACIGAAADGGDDGDNDLLIVVIKNTRHSSSSSSSERPLANRRLT
jgi:hypothetical protein